MEITEEELQLFSIFSKLTGVEPVGVERTEWGYVFLVPREELGRAIGKKGAALGKVRTRLRSNAFVFADSPDLEEFVRGLFNNIDIRNIEIREAMGERAVFLSVSDKDRGLAIGKDGMRIKIAKQLLKKKFNATISIKARRGVIEIPPEMEG